MSLSDNHIFRAVCRTLSVIVCGMAAGFLFYGGAIFVPTRTAFQFTLSSITAGLFFGLAKSTSYRNALAALLVWYVVSTLMDVHNSWLFILSLVYIACIAAAVYVYIILVRRPVFNGILQRLATISLLTGIFNAIVILLLSAIQSVFGYIRVTTVANSALDNFQIGTLIGLGIGIGIEIVEYLLRFKSFRQLTDI